MRRIARWVPAILLMAGIFILSAIPSAEMPAFGIWDTLLKKGGHMLGYGTLVLLYWYAMRWDRKRTWIALILAISYALSDEFHQMHVPGRHASLKVVATDGATAGAFYSVATHNFHLCK